MKSAESKPNAVESKTVNLLNESYSLASVKNGGSELPSFCVAVLKNGKTVKLEANFPTNFLETLKNSSIAWIDYWAEDFEKEAVKVSASMGFNAELVSSLLSGYLSSFEDLDLELGLMLPSISVDKFDVKTWPLIVLLKQNLVLTIHGKKITRFVRLRRYAETFMKKIPANTVSSDRLTMVLNRIIDENNSRNFDHLREIEEQGDKLSQFMLDPKTPRQKIGPQIYQMKHALIIYLNALWATFDLINSLRYGDAELITDNPKLLSKIGFLADNVNRQIELSEHMSEVLASGLEVLQSIYNNQLQVLNNRLAWVVTYLTIIGTAVLVPNTLATILGNPVYGFGPQQFWEYNLIIIGSTVIATIAVWWWIKAKKWVPEPEAVD